MRTHNEGNAIHHPSSITHNPPKEEGRAASPRFRAGGRFTLGDVGAFQDGCLLRLACPQQDVCAFTGAMLQATTNGTL